MHRYLLPRVERTLTFDKSAYCSHLAHKYAYSKIQDCLRVHLSAFLTLFTINRITYFRTEKNTSTSTRGASRVK